MSTINFSKKALELLQKKDKTKSKNHKAHFENFIKYYDINPSQTGLHSWIEDFILYYLYDRWCFKNGKKHQLNRNNFYKFCNLYFMNRRNYSENFSWYYVMDISAHITQEQINNLKESQKKYGKKDKKRTKRIPSS